MVDEITVNSRRFEGKIAAVTAAASGIGRASAWRLAQEGAHVIALDISPDVAPFGDELVARFGKGEARTLNVTKAEEVDACFSAVISEHGGIDVLVNVVGKTAGPRRSEFYLSQPDVWDEVIEMCLRTTMLCCRQVVPSMRSRRSGKIVNISSTAWMVPLPTFSEYAAAKAGVMGFTRSLAIEMAPHNVNVNVICPGPVATAATDHHSEDLRKKLISTIPLGRYGSASDVAAGVAYLASEDARFVTGQNLVISGGL